MSVLIVEGPDGAGKSTLITALQEYETSIGPPIAYVAHHGAYLGQDRIANHYLQSLWAARWQQRRAPARALERLSILDRSWLAEPIYGAVMRGGANRIAPWERRMLERVALGTGALIVICLPPVEACETSWQQRHVTEYPDSLTKVRALHAAYAGLLDRMTIFKNDGGAARFVTLSYDWTRETAVQFLDRLEPALRAAHQPGPGLGTWAPESTLLIGDAVSRFGHAGLPFVSLHRGGCSVWLAEQLEEWGVREDQLYWVNQAEVDDDFAEDAKRFQRIIALGQRAIDWGDDHGLDFLACEHPQYWKRFRTNIPYPLQRYLCST